LEASQNMDEVLTTSRDGGGGGAESSGVGDSCIDVGEVDSETDSAFTRSDDDDDAAFTRSAGSAWESHTDADGARPNS